MAAALLAGAGGSTKLGAVHTALRGKIVVFVQRGDFAFASGLKPNGTYEHVWFREPIGPDEIALKHGVFLFAKERAQAAQTPVTAPDGGPWPGQGREPGEVGPIPRPGSKPGHVLGLGPGPRPGEGEAAPAELRPKMATKTIQLTGPVPPELWNRLGTKVIPTLRKGNFELRAEVSFVATVDADMAGVLISNLCQILADLGLEDLGLEDRLSIEKS